MDNSCCDPSTEFVNEYVKFSSRYKFNIFLTLTTPPRHGDPEKIIENFRKAIDVHLREVSKKHKTTLNAMGLVVYDRKGHLHAHLLVAQKSLLPLTEEQVIDLNKWRYISYIEPIYDKEGLEKYIYSKKHFSIIRRHELYFYGIKQLIKQCPDIKIKINKKKKIKKKKKNKKAVCKKNYAY